MKSVSIPTTTFKFLKAIKKNNERPWFNENKEWYQKEHENFKAFANTLLDKVSHHDEIEKLRVHRIYRDVRFSKNKLPYKAHFSGGLTRAGIYLRGGYYFHVEPGNSFVAGGFWAPNSKDLKRIRQEIAADDQPLRKIIKAATFKKYFGELYGETLKTAPRGFPKDHPALDLLRYKQFLVIHYYTDQEVMADNFAGELNKGFKAMRPFFNYLSEVLTTDENGVLIQPEIS